MRSHPSKATSTANHRRTSSARAARRPSRSTCRGRSFPPRTVKSSRTANQATYKANTIRSGMASVASSAGWKGRPIRCTCASFFPAGAPTNPARNATGAASARSRSSGAGRASPCPNSTLRRSRTCAHYSRPSHQKIRVIRPTTRSKLSWPDSATSRRSDSATSPSTDSRAHSPAAKSSAST